MRKYFWQTLIITLSLIDLLFLVASTHLVTEFNYYELSVELIRLPIWLFIMIYVAQLKDMPTIFPWLLSGTILMYMGNVFNVNDEIFNLEHSLYQITEDLFLSLGVILLGIGFYKLIKQVTDQNKFIEDLASKDLLICLADRRSFFHEITHEKRVTGIKTNCFLIIDIDNLGDFTYKYGKACSDYLLIKLANLIGSVIRKQDRVCRRGGSEFIIELGHVNIRSAKSKAEQICMLMDDRYFYFAAERLHVTVSVGVSEYDGDPINGNTAIKKAEDALAVAKNEGTNLVKVSDTLRM